MLRLQQDRYLNLEGFQSLVVLRQVAFQPVHLVRPAIALVLGVAMWLTSLRLHIRIGVMTRNGFLDMEHGRDLWRSQRKGRLHGDSLLATPPYDDKCIEYKKGWWAACPDRILLCVRVSLILRRSIRTCKELRSAPCLLDRSSMQKHVQTQ